MRTKFCGAPGERVSERRDGPRARHESSPVSATCGEGKLRADAEARFEDGTRVWEELTRACTAKR